MFLLFPWAYHFLNISSFVHYNKRTNSLFPWVSNRFQKLDDSHLSVRRLIILFLSFLKQPSSGCFIFSQTTIQCSSHLFFSAQPCFSFLTRFHLGSKNKYPERRVKLHDIFCNAVSEFKSITFGIYHYSKKSEKPIRFKEK